jgi:hypothetical protein
MPSGVKGAIGTGMIRLVVQARLFASLDPGYNCGCYLALNPV